MIGKPDSLGVRTPISRSAPSTRAVLPWMSARSASPRLRLTSSPASTVAIDATGDGPEYRYGGASSLIAFFSLVGSAMKASRDE